MHPAIRTQADQLNDEASAEAEIRFDREGNQDMTRQEFKTDADINTILKRFGVHGIGGINEKKPEFRTVDYNLDLATAYSAIEQAKQAHNQLPANLRDRFKTWPELLNALDRGELKIITEEAPKDEPQPPA